jgi:hypothetical protein
MTIPQRISEVKILHSLVKYPNIDLSTKLPKMEITKQATTNGIQWNQITSSENRNVDSRIER